VSDSVQPRIAGRLNGRRVRVLALVLAPAIATACAAAIALGGAWCRRSCAVGRSASLAVGGSVGPTWHALDARVALVPPLEGGWAGWCVTIAERLGCQGTRFAPEGPIVAESWSGQFVQGRSAETTGWVITRPDVTAIELADGQRIATRAQSLLPSQLRAAVIQITARARGQQPGLGLPVPRLAALSAEGVVIPQTTVPDTRFWVSLPVTSWRAPSPRPQGGICRLEVSKVPGLAVRAGVVMTTPVSHPEPLGKPFVSCVSTEYTFGGSVVHGSVLLDATHPGSAPAALPGMHSLRGQAGTFVAPGAEGEMLARRASGAWLVVTGGGRHGLAQRLAVLKALRAAVRL
jgi:hypothetical protein